MHDDINEAEEGYEVEDHDIEETDKSDDSQFDVQNIRGLDNTFTSDESLFPPTFNVKEKERASKTRKKIKTYGALGLKGRYLISSQTNYYEKHIHKVACRISTRSGHKLIHEIMAGNETRCYQAFRMSRTVFINFCLDLQHNYGLNLTKEMSIYEEVCISLMTYAHGVGNHLIQEMFNHYGETFYRHFHQVLGVINKLVKNIIKSHPHYIDGVGYHMPQNKKYPPFFKTWLCISIISEFLTLFLWNYIGVIDDTHIKARLPREEEIPYIRRKSYPTQNVFAILDFNMCFTFAWAGWEGEAHDNRIFGEALRNQNLIFPYPLGHKYYLVDAGYGNKKGYLAPYKGENIRYHLEDFRRAKTRQLCQSHRVKEKFNFLHSYYRNIIKRIFGV
ncbi:Harbinger transposase-derived nuclease domain [Dillenia turbinata]|uniref:Harbinger transposase-derived nuclease domain n=1 Tax=Dillenia turbinata TaxID=194707 RepID=A0AAN8UW82_9MAGN